MAGVRAAAAAAAAAGVLWRALTRGRRRRQREAALAGGGAGARERVGPVGFVRDTRGLVRDVRALLLLLDDRGLLPKRGGGEEAASTSSSQSAMLAVRDLLGEVNATLDKASGLLSQAPVERVTKIVAGEVKFAPRPPGMPTGFERTRMLVEDARKAVEGCNAALEIRGVRACFPGERERLLGGEAGGSGSGVESGAGSPTKAAGSRPRDSLKEEPRNPIFSRRRRKSSKTTELARPATQPALNRVGKICSDTKDAVKTAKELLELDHVRQKMGSSAAQVDAGGNGSFTGGVGSAANSPSGGFGLPRVGSGGSLVGLAAGAMAGEGSAGVLLGAGGAAPGLVDTPSTRRKGPGPFSHSQLDAHALGGPGSVAQLRALENITRNTNVAMQALEKNVRTLSNPNVRREWRHFVYKLLLATFVFFAASLSYVAQCCAARMHLLRCDAPPRTAPCLAAPPPPLCVLTSAAGAPLERRWVWWLRSLDADQDGRITIHELCEGFPAAAGIDCKATVRDMFDTTHTHSYEDEHQDDYWASGAASGARSRLDGHPTELDAVAGY